MNRQIQCPINTTKASSNIQYNGRSNVQCEGRSNDCRWIQCPSSNTIADLVSTPCTDVVSIAQCKIHGRIQCPILGWIQCIIRERILGSRESCAAGDPGDFWLVVHARSAGIPSFENFRTSVSTQWFLMHIRYLNPIWVPLDLLHNPESIKHPLDQHQSPWTRWCRSVGCAQPVMTGQGDITEFFILELKLSALWMRCVRH